MFTTNAIANSSQIGSKSGGVKIEMFRVCIHVHVPEHEPHGNKFSIHFGRVSVLLGLWHSCSFGLVPVHIDLCFMYVCIHYLVYNK